MKISELCHETDDRPITLRPLQFIENNSHGVHTVDVYMYGKFQSGWDVDRNVDLSLLRQITEQAVKVGKNKKSKEIRKVIGA